MYGILHKDLFKWVVSLENGIDMLNEILAEVGYEGDPNDFFTHYDDEVGHQFIEVISAVTGYRKETVLLEAGKMTMQTFVDCGFKPILDVLGDNLMTILNNLNSLHFSFLGSFPEMKFPHINATRGADGALEIRYRSPRQGLASFMMGAVTSVARDLLGVEVEVIHKIKAKAAAEEDLFVAFLDPEAAFPLEIRDTFEMGHNMSTLSLDVEETAEALPWHFALNRDLRIVSVGYQLAARTKKEVLGAPVKKIFRIVMPLEAKWDFDSLADMEGIPLLFSSNTAMMLTADEYNEYVAATAALAALNGEGGRGLEAKEAWESNATSCTVSTRGSCSMDVRHRRMNDISSIKLHGEFVYDEENDLIIFAGSPHLKTLDELESQSVALKDIPIHTHGREILYQGMFQAVSARHQTEINAKLAELDHFAEEVVDKKAVIDNLLQSILPKSVADALSDSRAPESEEYHNVSVLYSDIAGFTNISSGVPSIEVMTLLHQMFVKFDDLCDKHGCYKVETIGDAYIVVAGCPTECDNHAERLAALALDMVKVANNTRSPLDGDPINIRIGLHSGPVRAGVVGRDRPRYCLFGDTCTVGCLMESSGIPCCIQASYRFLKQLPEQNPFLLAPRGFVKIKGKGMMKTFLLLGYVDSKEEYLFPDAEKYPKLFTDVMVFAYDARHRKRTMGHIPQLIGRPLETQMEHYKRNTLQLEPMSGNRSVNVI